MSDRVSGFIIVLEEDLKDEDAKPVLDAIALIKGVLRVEPHVVDVSGCIAATRAKMDALHAITHALFSGDK